MRVILSMPSIPFLWGQGKDSIQFELRFTLKPQPLGMFSTNIELFSRANKPASLQNQPTWCLFGSHKEVCCDPLPLCCIHIWLFSVVYNRIGVFIIGIGHGGQELWSIEVWKPILGASNADNFPNIQVGSFKVYID